jgi:hypothetical protein
MKNQWLAGASFLRWKMELARLENGEGHEIAAITPPLETRALSPVRKALCAFLSSLLRGLNEGLNTCGKVPPGRS